jgi:hypothetical protein
MNVSARIVEERTDDLFDISLADFHRECHLRTGLDELLFAGEASWISL